MRYATLLSPYKTKNKSKNKPTPVPSPESVKFGTALSVYKGQNSRPQSTPPIESQPVMVEEPVEPFHCGCPKDGPLLTNCGDSIHNIWSMEFPGMSMAEITEVAEEVKAEEVKAQENIEENGELDAPVQESRKARRRRMAEMKSKSSDTISEQVSEHEQKVNNTLGDS